MNDYKPVNQGLRNCDILDLILFATKSIHCMNYQLIVICDCNVIMLELLFCEYKFSLQDLPALQTFVFQINYIQTEVTPTKTHSTFTPHILTLSK